MQSCAKYYKVNFFCCSDLVFFSFLCFRRNVNLTQRIAYLARSVMCMRSDKVGCAPHLGIFLQELEDKIDVAHVQQQVTYSVFKFLVGVFLVTGRRLRFLCKSLKCPDHTN